VKTFPEVNVPVVVKGTVAPTPLQKLAGEIVPVDIDVSSTLITPFIPEDAWGEHT
jgi:hypothetical protein